MGTQRSMARLRVLNCLHRAHFGGAQWRVVWVGEALRQHGIESQILFPSGRDMEYERFLRERGFPFIRLKMPVIRALTRFRDNLNFLLDLPFQVHRILKFIRTGNFDLIHVNGMTNIGPLIAGILAGKPVIWHWNDTQTPKWLVQLARPLIQRSWLVASSHAVAENYNLVNHINRYLGTLPPPIPPDITQSGLADIGIYAEAFVIGFVGSIVAAKGVIEYVKVIARLRAEGHAVIGVMAGDVLSGHEEFGKKLGQIIAELGLDQYLLRLGYRYDVPSVMRHFDVLLFPSHTEAAPIVVLQAMALGIPVAATDVGNVHELLSGTGMGTVPIGDISSMVNAVRTVLLWDKTVRDDYSKKSKQISNQYSIDEIAKKHVTFYKMVIKPEP